MVVKKWLQKSLVILISIVTFGLVTPGDLSWLANADAVKSPKKDLFESREFLYSEAEESEPPFVREQFLDELKGKAEENSFRKFGEKISPKIGNEFRLAILPNIERTIEEMADQIPDEKLQFLSISEQPSFGKGEKIFHIMDSLTGEDIIRFHVRRERPPLEGYWFNFHYHTYHDHFSAHHELGSIYWDKNTPPAWGSRLLS
ncbi:YpjP family protein [Bacillus massiliglaciei]|uniref:YpjP family protein n=1 Tax=Bacillus massiliglaciei TaxID=1816693 RepID=UPI000B0A8068|nr:YpjP family protein [Bacillus massiliglaciei]